MHTDQTEKYWVPAVILVLMVVAMVWWYTATDTIPLVPNTGESTSTLEYTRD